MAAPKGNQFWKKRAKSGRDKIFKTPDDLWTAACEYFDWVEKTPLKEEKLFQYQGKVIKEEINKIRAMTIDGLCMFLGVNSEYLYDFQSNLDLKTVEGKEFSQIIGQIKTTIRNQKFEGAAADLLNANIIARELGLKEKTESTVDISVRTLDDFYNDIENGDS